MSRAEERRLDIMLGRLLRGGVILAAIVVLAGAIYYLWRHGRGGTAYATFHGEPADLRTLSGVMADVAALRPRGLIQLGLLLLIATPIARVAFSVYAFARLHDTRYVALTLIVLSLLLFSVFGTH